MIAFHMTRGAPVEPFDVLKCTFERIFFCVWIRAFMPFQDSTVCKCEGVQL